MWRVTPHSADPDGYRARLWSGASPIWWTEGYERKAGPLNAIQIAKASYNAPVVDRTQIVWFGLLLLDGLDDLAKGVQHVLPLWHGDL